MRRRSEKEPDRAWQRRRHGSARVKRNVPETESARAHQLVGRVREANSQRKPHWRPPAKTAARPAARVVNLRIRIPVVSGVPEKEPHHVPLSRHRPCPQLYRRACPLHPPIIASPRVLKRDRGGRRERQVCAAAELQRGQRLACFSTPSSPVVGIEPQIRYNRLPESPRCTLHHDRLWTLPGTA